MNTLRQQMEEAMALRGLALRTRETYIESVAKLAKFYGRRPDQISEAEVQRYLLHLFASQRSAARAAIALTLQAPSVIVVSSTLKPPRTRRDAHACVLSTTSHVSKCSARVATRYKSQTVAL